MRMLIDRVPLKEPLCEECVIAWWRNLIETIKRPTRH
jgi:hypothetical protein